ncbi:MAG: hypothetical protein P1U68_01595 [Verrucomicrobiales bacterium]|nr:hypothetical protein [Verrucomicrobiales bacterium]
MMNISYQTLLVGSVVTAVHVAAILVMKPATLEASKFFDGLELDGFVETVLVKQGRAEDFSPAEEVSSPVLAEVEETLSEPSTELVEETVSTLPAESPGKFIDLEKEMDSIKAVTDVRVFAGRIHRPELEEYTSARVVAEPVEEAAVEADAPAESVQRKSTKVVTPLNIREIRPLSRS